MNAHFLSHNPFEPRFKTTTLFPPLILPDCPENEAKWVIVPFRCMMNRPKDRASVDAVIAEYGAERVVVFDYSDQGNGDYPCRVFAHNVKANFPKTVFSYVDPYWRLIDSGKIIPAPVKTSTKYAFSFCGDITSHISRRNGIADCCKLRSKWECLFKFNPDGWVCMDDPQDDVYADSFNTMLMWCPPSRGPITGRLIHALIAGVGIITNLEEFRISPYVAGFLDLLPKHSIDGVNLADDVQRVLEDSDRENIAKFAQHKFEHYRNNFWQYVIAELNGEKIPA